LTQSPIALLIDCGDQPSSRLTGGGRQREREELWDKLREKVSRTVQKGKIGEEGEPSRALRKERDNGEDRGGGLRKCGVSSFEKSTINVEIRHSSRKKKGGVCRELRYAKRKAVVKKKNGGGLGTCAT